MEKKNKKSLQIIQNSVPFFKDDKIIDINTGEILVNVDKLIKLGDKKDIGGVLSYFDSYEKVLKKTIKQIKEQAKKELLKDQEGEIGEWKLSITNRSKFTEPKIEDLPSEIRDRYIEAKKFIEETNNQFGSETFTQYPRWTRSKY